MVNLGYCLSSLEPPGLEFPTINILISLSLSLLGTVNMTHIFSFKSCLLLAMGRTHFNIIIILGFIDSNDVVGG